MRCCEFADTATLGDAWWELEDVRGSLKAAVKDNANGTAGAALQQVMMLFEQRRSSLNVRALALGATLDPRCVALTTAATWLVKGAW